MDMNKAKITLGFNASTDLNEMSVETIHKHFMAKLQLDNYENAPETAVSSNAYHDYHEAYQFLNQKKKKRSGRAMTENWNLVGSKAGSKALMGGLLSKLKAGALAESRGEENPGIQVKISMPPVEVAAKKNVSTEVGKSASL